MSYTLTAEQTDKLLSNLAKDYKIFAPKRLRAQGRFSDTDIVSYGEVGKFDEIVWDTKSDYPAKEVITPIQQAIFYFTEDEYRESKAPTKPILIFARPCDINAQEIQAEIYAGNGGFTDLYYERKRKLVRFVMMECGGGDDTCFCVSMGSNKTDNYSIAAKFSCDGVQMQVVDDDFQKYFEGFTECDYSPEFVEENEIKVTIPDLSDKEVRKRLKDHPMWKEYNKRCISCGACTIACSTCTCFTTRDVIYGDNPEVGERRRISASCQIPGFDQMSGQKEFRSTAGDRMRYKVLHKFHDHKARFGNRNMCVGCGRCTHRCPEMIAIHATVNKVNDAVAEIKAAMENE